MRKVLIADASEPWRDLLARTMDQEYRIRTCADANQTMELVTSFEPDVLVMDLMLAGADGLSVLKSMEGRSTRPKIIITGRYFSGYITTSLERYQVDLAVLKPCSARSIAERVAELLSLAEDAPVQSPDPYDWITAMLVSLGTRTSQQGFRFLRIGIQLLMEDPHQQLTKQLYPEIARLHGTSAANVEKSIRTTVATAWSNRREEIWRRYFPPAPNGQIPRPTSGQFLARITDAALSALRRRA